MNVDSADLAKQSFDAVIKNISERCTSGKILQSMEHCGFSTQNVTYIHLPSSTKGNLGYCFVGFKSSQVAKDFCESSEFQLHLRGKNKIIHVEPLGFSLSTRKVTERDDLQRFQRHDGAETFGPVRPGERSGLPKPRELEEKACATLQWGYSQTLMSYFSRLSPQDYILTVPESHFGYG